MVMLGTQCEHGTHVYLRSSVDEKYIVEGMSMDDSKG